MSRVSVISVTFNNADGLEVTLEALSALGVKPLEVVVIDGGSKDRTAEVVRVYSSKLNIVYISEEDDGIYDAMNKGRSIAKGEFVNYLNAGDTIQGDPYAHVSKACRMPVILKSEEGSVLGKEGSVILGLGYNHQAIIFKVDHRPYDLKYRISADFDLILHEFPRGIASVPMSEDATVFYQFGGVSSVNRFERDLEIFNIIFNRRGVRLAILFAIYAGVKLAVPRWLRRKLKSDSKGLI